MFMRMEKEVLKGLAHTPSTSMHQKRLLCGIDTYQYLQELISLVSPFISPISEPFNVLLHSRYCTHTLRPSRTFLRPIRYPRPGSSIRSQIPPRIHASQPRCRCWGCDTWVGYTSQHCSSVTGTRKLPKSANP